MPLNSAQLATLKADILANNAVLSFGPYTGQTVAQVAALSPRPSEANIRIAEWYNLAASPQFVVWRDLPMESVLSLITYASMTPTDSPDGTQTWANRSLSCQGKQFNLQNLTIGRSTAPMKRTNYRSAMQDCLTGLPAGAGGATISANWVGVRDAAKFDATNGEKLFATGTGSAGSPADLVVEGQISPLDVDSALNLP